MTEAWWAATTLSPGLGSMTSYVRHALPGDLSKLRPNLRWADFWSTYDPAPAGPISPPAGVSVADRSHSTVNRMSILEDHGSYWDNDEEFLIPLLQHIDTPSGGPEDSRFFRDNNLGTVRLAWRRQRVAVLALWRWIATLGAGVPMAATTVVALAGAAGVAGTVGRQGPERLGADFAARWATIPGHEIIAGPLDGLSKVAGWPGALPLIGEWAMGLSSWRWRSWCWPGLAWDAGRRGTSESAGPRGAASLGKAVAGDRGHVRRADRGCRGDVRGDFRLSLAVGLFLASEDHLDRRREVRRTLAAA